MSIKQAESEELVELRKMVHDQYAALNTQNAIIHYLLDSYERIGIEYDLEEVVEKIVTQIPGVSIKEEKVNPSIITQDTK